jgi:uncharacterized membrane protein
MLERIRTRILTGFLTVIPILITVWIVDLALTFLIAVGRPFVTTLARSIRPQAPDFADLLMRDWFHSVLALLIVLIGLYVLGVITTIVVGRQLLNAFHGLMERIPLIQTVYGAARKVIASFQHTPTGQQRVVLIEFPSAEMKAVGLVMRTFTAADTAQELAAVYVPTTPNPTSGYVEIVPVEKLVWLDWSTNDAMQFIVSGGMVAPDRINFRPGRADAAGAPALAPQEAPITPPAPRPQRAG